MAPPQSQIAPPAYNPGVGYQNYMPPQFPNQGYPQPQPGYGQPNYYQQVPQAPIMVARQIDPYSQQNYRVMTDPVRVVEIQSQQGDYGNMLLSAETDKQITTTCSTQNIFINYF